MFSILQGFEFVNRDNRRRNLETDVSLWKLKTHQIFSLHTTPEEFENGGFTLKIKTHQMFSVHATPEGFENRGFTLKIKTHQILPVHVTPEEFENATISGLFWICVWETLGEGNRIILVKSNSFGLKSVFEKPKQTTMATACNENATKRKV